MTSALLIHLALQAAALPTAPAITDRSKTSVTTIVAVRILQGAAIGKNAQSKIQPNGQMVHQRKTMLPDSAGALRPAVIFEFE